MNRVINILVASVGGQGGLTLSRVIAAAAVMAGYSVRTGETLGMAQRFGSVKSYIRIGVDTPVYSPIFEPREADILVGMEVTETYRNHHYLRPMGLVVLSTEEKPPISVSLGKAEPVTMEKLIEALESHGAEIIIIDAPRLAREAGNPRAANMVLLGAMNAAKKILPDNAVEEAIKAILGGKRAETSIKAYYLGKEYTEKHKPSKEHKEDKTHASEQT